MCRRKSWQLAVVVVVDYYIIVIKGSKILEREFALRAMISCVVVV